MSTLDAKLEQQRNTEEPARRTYASLEAERRFRAFGKAVDGHHAMHIEICPMDTWSEWRHVGNGHWNARDAMYEEVTP